MNKHTIKGLSSGPSGVLHHELRNFSGTKQCLTRMLRITESHLIQSETYKIHEGPHTYLQLLDADRKK